MQDGVRIESVPPSAEGYDVGRPDARASRRRTCPGCTTARSSSTAPTARPSAPAARSSSHDPQPLGHASRRRRPPGAPRRPAEGGAYAAAPPPRPAHAPAPARSRRILDPVLRDHAPPSTSRDHHHRRSWSTRPRSSTCCSSTPSSPPTGCWSPGTSSAASPSRSSTARASRTASEPHVAIVMPAFNEEDAIADSLRSLLALDYPADKLQIVAVNDCYRPSGLNAPTSAPCVRSGGGADGGGDLLADRRGLLGGRRLGHPSGARSPPRQRRTACRRRARRT